MISVSRLLCGAKYYGDSLRYKQDAGCQRDGTTAGHGPVVVWNTTRTCNLRCLHCYSNSDDRVYENELSTIEAKKFIDDLASFNVPVILFPGVSLYYAGTFLNWLITPAAKTSAVPFPPTVH